MEIQGAVEGRFQMGTREVVEGSCLVENQEAEEEEDPFQVGQMVGAVVNYSVGNQTVELVGLAHFRGRAASLVHLICV
jgi:hypothetical protein